MIIFSRKMLAITCAAFFVTGLFSGCSHTSKTAAEQDLEIAPVSSSLESHEDIKLPSEMKIDADTSMAIKTASFIGGQYRFTGKVDANSLREFIKKSMANNKWKLVGEATFQNTMLAFVKPNKTCMMTITEGFGGPLGSTILDMSVTVDVAAASGLNPFGEPQR